MQAHLKAFSSYKDGMALGQIVQNGSRACLTSAAVSCTETRCWDCRGTWAQTKIGICYQYLHDFAIGVRRTLKLQASSINKADGLAANMCAEGSFMHDTKSQRDEPAGSGACWRRLLKRRLFGGNITRPHCAWNGVITLLSRMDRQVVEIYVQP
jgi:hypothetical protein